MTKSSATVSVSSSASSPLAASLRQELLALPYGGFAQCVTELLEKLGYTQVQRAGRRDWKGRNQHGGGSGFDLTALAPQAVPSQSPGRRVVVSLKPLGPEQVVHQRTVDQLRGAGLRVGASEGLLITTGNVSPTARVPQAASLMPVAILEGGTLLTLLIRHRVGLREDEGYLTLDAAWFARLRQEGRNDRPTGSRSKPQNPRARLAASPIWVQVQVEALLPSEGQIEMGKP